MKSVTRARPKTDRIACPWVIRKFIDPEAETLHVPTDRVLAVAKEQGAHSSDAPGAEFTHRGARCSFETLIEEFDLSRDAPLVRLARIVHAADVSADRDSDPLGAGLEAISAPAASTSRPTTIVSSSAPRSSMTPSTRGALDTRHNLRDRSAQKSTVARWKRFANCGDLLAVKTKQ